MEVWKTINNYENYEVSNLGNIRNKNSGRLLSQRTTSKGYKGVVLYNNGSHKDFLVHRLVLMAFCPKDGCDKLQVNHLDENRSNNWLGNLEWCTAKENLNYGSHNKKVSLSRTNYLANSEVREELSIKMKNSPKAIKQREIFKRAVKQLSLEGKFIREFDSVRGASRVSGVDSSSISKCCRGLRSSVGGFKWVFKEVCYAC